MQPPELNPDDPVDAELIKLAHEFAADIVDILGVEDVDDMEAAVAIGRALCDGIELGIGDAAAEHADAMKVVETKP